jgi:hypothetical protein
MKTQKLLVIVASVCLMAVFVAGSAYAGPLGPIKAEFCAQVAEDAFNAGEELVDGARDLEECVGEYGRCGGRGPLEDSPAECLNEGFRCISFANNDLQQACGKFASDFEEAYRRALRQARREGLEDRFERWLGRPAGQACLQPAIEIGQVCAGLTE